MVNVFRNGARHEIHQSDVLVGDIMSIETGMEIPADGWLLEGSEVTTDESAMTGETDPMKKENIADCLLRKK
jgi:P-type E1-E2 ATPase